MKERFITPLPSGSFRVRVTRAGRAVAETLPTLDAAKARRDVILHALAEGSFAHANDLLGRDHIVCGIAPVRLWPTCGGVYFCAVPSIAQVKIGWAANVRRRLNDLACGAPRLVLLARMDGGRETELALHDRFTAYRMLREWFRLEGEVLAFVKDLRAAS